MLEDEREEQQHLPCEDVRGRVDDLMAGFAGLLSTSRVRISDKVNQVISFLQQTAREVLAICTVKPANFRTISCNFGHSLLINLLRIMQIFPKLSSSLKIQ